MNPYVIAIVGPSGSGKTCLIEKLVPLLTKRGLKVGTIKHAHDRIDLDLPGKDSWRHLKAGAEVAAVVGPQQLMVMKVTLNGRGLDEALDSLPKEIDLILLEGFHEENFPQIAVMGQTGKVRGDQRPIRRAGRLLAVVSGRPIEGAVRQFKFSQIGELAKLIEGEWIKQWEASFQRPSRGSSSQEV